jgi:purine-binding chemotaxis protein CheW
MKTGWTENSSDTDTSRPKLKDAGIVKYPPSFSLPEKEEHTMAGENSSETTQYLTFRLQEEIYAVDVANIREILDFIAITKVPKSPEFMRGVINLRGSVVPVIDMKLKFGLPKTEKTVNTCIIVMEISVDGETVIIGSLADAVQEVLEMEPEQIEPAPRIGTRLNTEFIKGMGKRNDHFLMILDIDKIFSFDDITALHGDAETDGSDTLLEAS